jgi:hypothetical protein
MFNMLFYLDNNPVVAPPRDISMDWMRHEWSSLKLLMIF